MKPLRIPWVVSNLPTPNARAVLSRNQRGLGLLALLLLGYAMWAHPRTTFLTLNIAAISAYLIFSHYKLVLQFLSLRRAARVGAATSLPDGALPNYTVLIPLYREEKAVAGLFEHLKTLDYPKEKLQILLLAEEDDTQTRAVIDTLQIAPPFEVLLVSVSLPRTKPKACNHGLEHARGELLVIYDAEDRPETDQLKKAAGIFAQSPAELICVQAQLNFYNRDRNLLTRLFTAEYSCWFDFCLPGLFHLDAPIPLGGTSNHFRLAALRRLKGWDPYNVTEDCDLGIRLYIAGQRTGMLDSTTWEEATFRIMPWVRQRSRWIKGHLQTYLVHLRQHFVLLRKMGLRRTLHFHLLFGATCFCLMMNPVYWVLTAVWLGSKSQAISNFFPLWVMVPALVSFLAGNAAFVLSGMLACLARRNYHLVPYCLLIPLYWVLMSLAAWKGILQLVTNPFYWEKTPHEGAMTPGQAA